MAPSRGVVNCVPERHPDKARVPITEQMMALTCYLMLWAFCPLSLCCDTRLLGHWYLQSKLWQLPFVILFQKGE